MTRRVFLSIGSNIEPETYVPACFKKLKELFRVVKISSIYETDPVGPAGGTKFWNAAAEIETALAPDQVAAGMRAIEASLGRKRDPADKFAPRTIDIDVLPQADYQKQGFIMVPLAEIAPREKDAESGKTFGEIAESFRNAKEKCGKVTERPGI